jgi:hypothetical protein
MKNLPKLILPVLLIIVAFLVYKIYFSSGKSLGSFSDFDFNNNAVKSIRVELLKDRGIDRQKGAVVFYVSDKNGQVVMVTGEVSLPQGIETAKVITLKGHLTQSSFHTHDVVIE